MFQLENLPQGYKIDEFVMLDLHLTNFNDIFSPKIYDKLEEFDLKIVIFLIFRW